MATPPKIPGAGAFLEKDSGTPAPPAPRLVATAARLLVVAACVQLVASIVAVIYSVSAERLASIKASQATMTGNVPSLEALRNMGVLTVVLAGLATVCAYLLFAWFLRKGRSWARVAVGVLAALTCVQLVGITLPLGLTTVAQLILGGAALALCYLPEPNKFFADMKALRA